MTDISDQAALPINAKHVLQQFARRGDLSDAEFLYGEVAQRMLDRLKLIRLTPNAILDAGCATGRRWENLRARFPDADIVGLDHNPALLAMAQQRLKLSWGARLSSLLRNKQPKITTVCADLAESGLAPESMDLVWSNLAIHWHARPHDVLREWARVLKPGGLVFFSGWGPATGIEVRQALTRAKLHTDNLPLVDMHDLGDLMIQHGLADPVMDQESITLTYTDPLKMLADVRALGGNPNPSRKSSLVSRQWHSKLVTALEQQRDDCGKLSLTIELAYGHAWKSAVRRLDGETRISVQSLTRGR